MKKRIIRGIFTTLTILILVVCCIHFVYMNEINNMTIGLEFNMHATNSYYVRLVVLLPEDEYHGMITMLSIRQYILNLNREPTELSILIYDNWDSVTNGKQYAEHRFTWERIPDKEESNN